MHLSEVEIAAFFEHYVFFVQIILFLQPLEKANDSVAQLVEQYTFNVWVLGSSPSGITKKSESEVRARLAQMDLQTRIFFTRISKAILFQTSALRFFPDSDFRLLSVTRTQTSDSKLSLRL
jgi:hypothetical protein